MLGLENGIDDQLAGMLIRQPVVHTGALLPGGHHPGHPHLGRVL
jgi:hypothetical protein